MAAEFVQMALEWQIAAPVSRINLSDYPAAVDAMNPTREFLDNMASERRAARLRQQRQSGGGDSAGSFTRDATTREPPA